MSLLPSEKGGYWRDIKFNPVPIEEYFHIIDELGRYVINTNIYLSRLGM